jgi:uncharacterized protein with GYD domain
MRREIQDLLRKDTRDKEEDQVYTACFFGPTASYISLERRKSMPSFLLQVSYTAETMAAFVKKPQNRTEVVRKTVEKLGGSLSGLWLSFGDYDAVAVIEMPDNTSAAAFALAAAAGGACKAVKTTPLLSPEDGVAAMKKASGSGYKGLATK